MYLEHYGLKEPPFRITPHTDFFFAGANRGATLEALLYAVTHDEGIIKISGEVGSGKTMLCRVLMERLPENVFIIYLANPSLSRQDILYALADELGLEIEENIRPNSLMRALQQKLVDFYGEGKQVVVLIDEAHAMPKETLEEIRLLSNLESNRHKLLQLVLFGQPELNETLARDDMRQLRDRITQSFSLEPLVREDIAAYLDFRMRAAGYHGPRIFSDEAIRLIEKSSQGYTRRINILADKSLLAAFATGTHLVGPKEAQDAIRDAEFTAHPPLPTRARPFPTGPIWGLGGVLATLGVIALWQLAAKPVAAPLPVIPPSAATIGGSITTAPSLEAQPFRGKVVSSLQQEKAKSGGTESIRTLELLLVESRSWIAATEGSRWFLQLFTTSDAGSPAVVEQFFAEAQSAGLDLSQMRLYQSEFGGVSRYGIIYGNYASYAEAMGALEQLPQGLKKNKPYPRQVISLRSSGKGKPARRNQEIS